MSRFEGFDEGGRMLRESIFSLAGLMLAPAAALAFTPLGATWSENQRPVPYMVNPSGAPAGFLDAINAATGTWTNDARFDFDFRYSGFSSAQGADLNDGQQVIYWNSSGSGMSETTLATTYHWRRGAEMLHFDMAFNGRHPWSATPSSSQYDIQSVALHEFGHALGLEHSEQWSAVMYYSTPIGAKRRTLQADDVAGAASLYAPRQQALQPSPAELLEPAGSQVELRPTFRWRPASNAVSYGLSVDRLVNGARQAVLRIAELKATEFTPGAALTPGFSYVWQVTSRSQDGLANASAQLLFSLGTTRPSAPQVISPGQSSTRRPTFAWQPVPGAAQYYIWVSEIGGRSGIIRQPVSGTSLVSPVELRSGQGYYWWVRASSASGEHSEWTARAFRAQ